MRTSSEIAFVRAANFFDAPSVPVFVSTRRPLEPGFGTVKRICLLERRERLPSPVTPVSNLSNLMPDWDLFLLIVRPGGSVTRNVEIFLPVAPAPPITRLGFRDSGFSRRAVSCSGQVVRIE